MSTNSQQTAGKYLCYTVVSYTEEKWVTMVQQVCGMAITMQKLANFINMIESDKQQVLWSLAQENLILHCHYHQVI